MVQAAGRLRKAVVVQRPLIELPLGIIAPETGIAQGRRPYTAPGSEAAPEEESAPGLSDRGRFLEMEHETRFELATLTLAT